MATAWLLQRPSHSTRLASLLRGDGSPRCSVRSWSSSCHATMTLSFRNHTGGSVAKAIEEGEGYMVEFVYCKIEINLQENTLTTNASDRTLPPGLSSTVSSPDSAIQKEERTISRTREEDVYTLRFGRCGLPIIQIPSHNSCRTPQEADTIRRIGQTPYEGKHARQAKQERGDA